MELIMEQTDKWTVSTAKDDALHRSKWTPERNIWIINGGM